MTKRELLNEFNEMTHIWSNFYRVQHYEKILRKEECQKLYDLAKQGYTDFRLFDTHGYALTENYEKIYAYMPEYPKTRRTN